MELFSAVSIAKAFNPVVIVAAAVVIAIITTILVEDSKAVVEC